MLYSRFDGILFCFCLEDENLVAPEDIRPVPKQI